MMAGESEILTNDRDPDTHMWRVKSLLKDLLTIRDELTDEERGDGGKSSLGYKLFELESLLKQHLAKLLVEQYMERGY